MKKIKFFGWGVMALSVHGAEVMREAFRAFSEVTDSAPDDTSAGHTVPAAIIRNLSRLLFSYPASMGITWWNVVDGGAASGESSRP